jgi:hypothetical protein
VNDDTLLQLMAPQGDEELVGAVLTTFVVDGRFLEEELLTTLVGLPVGSGELQRASSELHQRLLAADGAVTVFVDERGFDGSRHVGTYDLCQVPAPPTFHPKVSLVLWQEATQTPRARALVASANLTREGYRRNAEVAVLADSIARDDHDLLADVVGYLRSIPGSRPEAVAVLDAVEALLTPTGKGSRRLVSSRGRPMLELFMESLHDRESIESAVVVSPFFERTTDVASASTIERWCQHLLARGGTDFDRARFFVPERFADGKLVVELPIARAVDLLGTRAELWTLDSLWSIEGRAEPVPRPLHGKLLALETNRRCLILAGSANFTNAALLTNGNAANWEASVVLSLPKGAIESALPTAATQRDPAAVRIQPPETEPPLPPLLFERALYEAASRELRIEPRPRMRSAESWTLTVDGDPVANGPPGGVRRLVIELARHPVTFSVEQTTALGSRHFPIEVTDKENLPLPGAGRQPRGEDVLDYFAGLRTPGEFDATRGDAQGGDAAREELPALEHLSRFSRALFGVQDHLDRPARSTREYQARWTGAWGLARLIEMLEERISTSRDDPAYSLFEVLELEATLRSLSLEADERCTSETKNGLRDSALSRLRGIRNELEKGVRDAHAVGVLRRAYDSAGGEKRG